MPLLELQQITKTFGGLNAINGFDLKIEKGQIVGLIGPNGAGKTTLFNIISGAFPPTSGKIIFKGKDITGLGPSGVARHGLIRTFQLITIFKDMTVLENILLGFHLTSGLKFWPGVFNTASSRAAEKNLLERAREMADLVGLKDKQNEIARNLSYGHQKSLQIAISLAANPELLLLDEPFNGMSAEEQNAMMVKIRSIRERGVTILIVEHVMNIIMQICDNVYVLAFGKKLAEGTPQEICVNKEVIAAYLGNEYASRS